MDVRVKVLLLIIVLIFNVAYLHFLKPCGASNLRRNVDVSLSDLWHANDGLCLTLCLFLDDRHCRGRTILTMRQNVIADCLNFAESHFAIPDKRGRLTLANF